MKHIVGIVVIGALALAGCGGNEKVEASAQPDTAAATTSTTLEDSLVCIQDASSPVPWGDEAMREPPCPSPSTATVPEDGARTRVQARAAQSDLRNALTALKVYYTDTQEYTDDVESLAAIESSLDWGGALTVAIGGEYDSVVCVS